MTRFKPLLENRLFGLFFGLVGLVLLLPLMLCIALMIRLLSDEDRAIFRRVPVSEHPLHTVLAFNTRGRLGDFLRRTGLYALPASLSLIGGEVTAIEVLRVMNSPGWYP